MSTTNIDLTVLAAKLKAELEEWAAVSSVEAMSDEAGGLYATAKVEPEGDDYVDDTVARFMRKHDINVRFVLKQSAEDV